MNRLDRVVRTQVIASPDHVLQWRDETRGWMDLESSIAERLKLLAALEPPERDRLAANWQRFGRVPDILDVLAVHTALTTGVEPDAQT